MSHSNDNSNNNNNVNNNNNNNDNDDNNNNNNSNNINDNAVPSSGRCRPWGAACSPGSCRLGEPRINHIITRNNNNDMNNDNHSITMFIIIDTTVSTIHINEITVAVGSRCRESRGLRISESNSLGNSTRTWEFHPLALKNLLESNPLESRFLACGLAAARHACNTMQRVGLHCIMP